MGDLPGLLQEQSGGQDFRVHCPAATIPGCLLAPHSQNPHKVVLPHSCLNVTLPPLSSTLAVHFSRAFLIFFLAIIETPSILVPTQVLGVKTGTYTNLGHLQKMGPFTRSKKYRLRPVCGEDFQGIARL